MLDKVILSFPEQFVFEPLIENEGKLKTKKKFIVCGMGGSQLAADILKAADPSLDLIGWRDYALPPANDIKDRLIILSSYSGNTEEVIESFEKGLEEDLSMAVISKGGALIELARTHKIPYVLIPDTGIQPRHATGFMVRALLAIMKDKKGLMETRELLGSLRPQELNNEASKLERELQGKVPLVYASAMNETLARNWKIKFNENAKIPAFWNVFPELNHNEMTGFDLSRKSRTLFKNFYFIFLEDDRDYLRTRKRMEVTEKMLEKRGFSISKINLKGETRYERLFQNIILAEWVSFHLARFYGSEPEKVPMVEEFKKEI